MKDWSRGPRVYTRLVSSVYALAPFNPFNLPVTRGRRPARVRQRPTAKRHRGEEAQH